MNTENIKYNISGLDNNDEKITLDDWKFREKVNKIIMSEWRQKQNKNHPTEKPGLDDLRKIKMHLKKKYPDEDIIKAFGITMKILIAIKKDKYDCVDGILSLINK